MAIIKLAKILSICGDKIYILFRFFRKKCIIKISGNYVIAIL